MPRSEINPLSVYSELLRLALDREPGAVEPVGDLMSRAMAVRPAAGRPSAIADHIAEWLAYDVILVRLCESLHIPHRMLEPDAGPSSREEAEMLVATQLPAFTGALRTA